MAVRHAISQPTNSTKKIVIFQCQHVLCKYMPNKIWRKYKIIIYFENFNLEELQVISNPNFQNRKKMKIALFVQNKFFWFKERFARDQIAILMMQTKISIKQCLKNFISKNKYISSLCIMQSWAKGKKIAFKTLWRYPVSSWFLLRQIILAEKLIRWYWGMKNHIHHTALNSLINIAKRKQPIMSEAW